MGHLYRGNRIFRQEETGREIINPIAFRWDDMLDAHSGKGLRLPFDNKAPKTFVRLSGDRMIWLLVPYSVFCRAWEAYLNDDEEPTPIPRAYSLN